MNFSETQFQNLSITDDFVFCSVMTSSEELCREMAERILGRKIGKIVRLDKQKSIQTTPDGKGVRFDVYFEDDRDTVYDIEMQNANEKNLPHRARYYQSMIDMEQMEKGMQYEEMKNSYVIFICMFDPFGMGLQKYTVKSICEEEPQTAYEDGTRKVFLNPYGTKRDEDQKLQALFRYLDKRVPTDGFTERLEKRVRALTRDADWRRQYMTLYERDQRNIAKGREEGLEAGREEGRKQQISDTITQALKRGKALSELADFLGMTEEEIRKFCSDNDIALNG
ncbi:MAG: Rpn family recombination-promoting nuclease/putative transposase [Clostridiales bacterium]|jgi:predicted transposase/invertase (TIGR01784 family)|nr:Rpn family recombination-promoting nuclease/putative transposase [Clostridiales bacterium]